MKYRRTRLNSEVIYSGEDLIRFDEKKKKDGKPKISGEKNVSTEVFRGF